MPVYGDIYICKYIRERRGVEREGERERDGGRERMFIAAKDKTERYGI